MDEVVEVMGDHPAVLRRAELAVARVDDEVRTVLDGGPHLDRGAEGGTAASGEAGGVEGVEEVHDHSCPAIARRRSRSANVVLTRHTMKAAPTRPHAAVVARRSGSFAVPIIRPCTMAIAHRP